MDDVVWGSDCWFFVCVWQYGKNRRTLLNVSNYYGFLAGAITYLVMVVNHFLFCPKLFLHIEGSFCVLDLSTFYFRDILTE